MAETRWQGYSHEELYRLINEGAGPAASAEPSRRWAEISATLTEVGQDLRQAIGKSGAAWSGPAAGAAHDRLAGLVDWAAQTGTNAGEMRNLVEDQAEFLARARAEMPVPEDTKAAAPDPAAAPAAAVLASQRDQEPVEAAASTGAQRAFEVMAAYQRDTTTNTGALASFATPAELAAPGEVHRHQGAGVQTTTPNVSPVVAVPPVQRDHDDHGRGQGPGPRGDGRGGGGWAPTTGAYTDAPAMRRPVPPSPGLLTGAAPIGGPLFGPAPLGSTSDDQRSARGGSGGRRGVVPTTGTGPGITGSGPGGVQLGSGATLPGTPGTPGFDLQSAAAGQAAAATGTPAAATPGVAAGTNSADAKAMRRFGVETIGTGQWFGDPPDPDPNPRPAARGRWASREDERVTEQVNIDGEDHNLPPTVIGDGPT